MINGIHTNIDTKVKSLFIVLWCCSVCWITVIFSTNYKVMEEDNQEDTSLNVSYHRSPIFRKNEVKALVDQIGKYKSIILNKCTNSTSNQAKEDAWEKICKEINRQGFEHKRTVDVLKTKWLNLKRLAKKVSKNIMDVNGTDINNILAQVVMMINENEANTSISEVSQEDKYPLKLKAINDMVVENDSNTSNLWESNDQSEESNDGDNTRRGSRSLNFTPSECSLLLRCVRDEKDNILYKGRGSTGRAMKIANSAWHRITHKYNKQSTLKRSTKMLRTKFSNMKKLTNFKKPINKNMKNERLDQESVEIKFEPNLESNNKDTEDENDIDNDVDTEEFAEMHVDPNTQNEDNSDPLCVVLNGDSGIESISHSGSYSQFDNKEVVKLKLELLKYQLETAKLERQRIKDALAAEISDRQSKAIETSLRLRAARLNAVSSESRLPSTHPALQYCDQEKLAEQYMRQFEHTCSINKSESYID